MRDYKELIDKIEIPKPDLEPLGILQLALERKRKKRLFESRVFMGIQLLVISALVMVAYVSIDWFVYIQIPVVFFGIGRLVVLLRKKSTALL